MLNLLSPLFVASSAVGAAVAAVSQATAGDSFLSFLNAPTDKSGDTAVNEAPVQATVDADNLPARQPPIVDQLRQHLLSAGIDLADPIALTAGVTGGVEVNAEHPQWRKIEAAINAVPGLAEQLGEWLREAEQNTGKLSADAELILNSQASVLRVDGKLLSQN